ncbi:MAG: hypothetical protein U0325_20715 [Polyangiales bacterium]
MRRGVGIAVALALVHELAAAYLAAHPLTTLLGASGWRALLGVGAYGALLVARVGLIGVMPAWLAARAARGRAG